MCVSLNDTFPKYLSGFLTAKQEKIGHTNIYPMAVSFKLLMKVHIDTLSASHCQFLSKCYKCNQLRISYDLYSMQPLKQYFFCGGILKFMRIWFL